MVKSCCAYGCTNRAVSKGESEDAVSFYRFPKGPEERRRRWILAVKRENWQPTEHSRICSVHFVTG